MVNWDKSTMIKSDIIKIFRSWSLVKFGLFRSQKALRQQLILKSKKEKAVLFILGCQRSGTSLMYWIFERDYNTKIFREKSSLSSKDPEHLRLNSMSAVENKLNRIQLPIVVLKPLVESQRCHMLLDSVSSSRAIWMYRHYRDVAVSNLKAFGLLNGIADLRYMVNGVRNDWRTESMSHSTLEVIRSLFSEQMNPYDAAALFWWARNSLYFDMELYKDPRVMLCRYETLAANPKLMMRRIYRFVGSSFPKANICKDVHSKSVGKGQTIELSESVLKLCKTMLLRLEAIDFKNQIV